VLCRAALVTHLPVDRSAPCVLLCVACWQEAARAYIKAAETAEKFLKAESDACNYYLNAAKAYKNAGSKEASRLFKTVVALHMEHNRFNTAAKIFKEIAEIDEKDGNIPAAMEAYEQAADCYTAEDQQTSANQCRLKIAHYAALREDHKRAIDIYEKVSTASLSNQLLMYSVKDYMFKALLCHFVLAAKSGSTAVLTETVDKYKNMNPRNDTTLHVAPCPSLE
jgi:alpha-soluble NSF attachment protein